LTAVPPLAVFLAALDWAPVRAFRARLDFEAVIRASPPVMSRLLLCARPWSVNAAGPNADARFYRAGLDLHPES